MSSVSASTTASSQTVVCSRASPIRLTMASTSVGLAVWCGSATTLDLEGHSEDFWWPPHCATAATTSLTDAFPCICQLCHGSSSGELSLSALSLLWIHYVVCWGLLCCLLFTFRFPCDCHVHQWGLNCWGLLCCNCRQYTLGRHMFLLMMVCSPCQECTECLILPLLQEGGGFMLLIQLSPAIPSIFLGIKLWGLGKQSPNPFTFLTWTLSTLYLWWV